MRDVLMWLISVVVGYGAGSIPFGYLIGRLNRIDIREHGSGNIGATNVWRVLGKIWGSICFTLDVLKGGLPVLLAGYLLGALNNWSPPATLVWMWLSVVAAAIAGHMYPVWLRGKGGKGVATGFGAMLAMFPIATVPALLALVSWIVTLRLTRYVSVASCIAAATLPLGVIVMMLLAQIGGAGGFVSLTPLFVLAVALAALVVWRHRGNLARVRAGSEPQVGRKRVANSAA